MGFIVAVSAFIIPLIIFYVVVDGIIHQTDVYDVFVEGAKDGMKTVVSILPTLIGLMMAVGILRASGFLAWISAKIGILTDPFGIPSQMIPLIIVRMFSSSAATGLSLDLFREYGTDSYIGLITSIMMSCTETIFIQCRSIFWRQRCERRGGRLREHLYRQQRELQQVFFWHA